MSALRLVTRSCNLRTLRQISKSVSSHTTAEAVSSSPSEPPMPIPSPDGIEKNYSPKITKLANDISGLTLLECADLSSLLKKQLNLPDAPVMAMGAFAPAAAAQPAEEEEEKIVQSLFTVKLTKYDEKQKVPLIKEIKSLLEGMNLVQAKKFVESIPAVVKADVTKEEAEQLKNVLAKVGGEVTVE